MDWNNLQTAEGLQEIIELSHYRPVAIFKHSVSCPISSMAKRRLEQNWPENLDIYYLDLIKYRPVSNMIAEELNVAHESPQLIVLYNGNVLYHNSHLNINVSDVVSSLSAVKEQFL